MPENLWYLNQCELFQSLTDEQISKLEAQSRVRTFPKNSPIYLSDERANYVFLLAEGLMKISHITDEGKESILAFIQSGDLFGELAIFENEQTDEYLYALEASTLVMIPKGEMTQLMVEHAEVAVGMTKIIGRRHQQIERRLKNLLFLSNREKLVHVLLDLAEQFGSFQNDQIHLRIKLSHQDLASLIGSTRETVTLTLGRLRLEGNVSIAGRQNIILTHPNILARSVHRNLQGQPHLRPTLLAG